MMNAAKVLLSLMKGKDIVLKSEMIMPSTVLIQIDCDSELAISNHYGIKLQTDKNNRIYYQALDMFLDLLCKYNLKATLFVIGNDLRDHYKCEILNKALQNGHEIANHTYHHPKQLLLCSEDMLIQEIIEADIIINKKLGVKPIGFRTPNFEADSRIIKILNKLDYRYDCSLLATPYLPLFRLIKQRTSSLKSYLGKWEFMLAPNGPYYPREDLIWKTGNQEIGNNVIEIPVSTFPFFRFPCHSSYLLALPGHFRYKILDSLLRWYKALNRPLIYIFHLADIVDNQYLYGTEKELYKSLNDRLFFVETFMKAAESGFYNCTTKEYFD
ncbi:MAG: polysaccharide deacetylase [Herbinix sp.]|jgi:hypothetical protein|nr:polysaccharide deacetylase [Herbinix sp.]